MLASSNDESGIANVTFERERLYINGQLAQIIGFDDESVLVNNGGTSVQIKFHTFTYLDQSKFSLQSYGIARAKVIMYEQREEEALQKIIMEGREGYLTVPLPCESAIHPRMLSQRTHRVLYTPILNQSGQYRMIPCCDHCYRRVKQQREQQRETGPIVYTIGEEG